MLTDVNTFYTDLETLAKHRVISSTCSSMPEEILKNIKRGMAQHLQLALKMTLFRKWGLIMSCFKYTL